GPNCRRHPQPIYDRLAVDEPCAGRHIPQRESQCSRFKGEAPGGQDAFGIPSTVTRKQLRTRNCLMFVVLVFVAFVFVIIAIVAAIPLVIMLDAAVSSAPVAVEVLPGFIARRNPRGTAIRRARPVTFMPAVVPSVRIPVPVNPDVTRAW